MTGSGGRLAIAWRRWKQASPLKPHAGMRAADSNVIVRYLTGDDPAQAGKARGVIGHEPVFVPTTVVLEVEWVLRGVYGLPANQVIPALRALAGLPGVSIENAPRVARALEWAEAGMEFADALHVAAAADCACFLTFDNRLARSGARAGGVAVTVLGYNIENLACRNSARLKI